MFHKNKYNHTFVCTDQTGLFTFLQGEGNKQLKEEARTTMTTIVETTQFGTHALL